VVTKSSLGEPVVASGKDASSRLAFTVDLA
jgi:hypothetical protein